ncbi:MAG: hypothetical protein HQ564_01560 [Candidatus Saganbacteria bacterium]|nr:hypothetical protein [Candidatus Saganbacteria bacterium]
MTRIYRNKIGIAGCYNDSRTPLIPSHIRRLRGQGIDLVVRESKVRDKIFPREGYVKSGIPLVGSLSDCKVILSMAAPSTRYVFSGTTYLNFSHDISGQPYQPLSSTSLIARGCQLIDFKRIVDDEGKRVTLFSDFTGKLGMVETIWALGQRLDFERVEKNSNPFLMIRRAGEYESLAAAEDAFRQLGFMIDSKGVPDSVFPFVCGFAGTGNDGGGAISMFRNLNPVTLRAKDLRGDLRHGDFSKYNTYMVILDRGARVIEKDSSVGFSPDHFNRYPERYQSDMEQYLANMVVFVNAIYWDERFPRLITNPILKRLDNPRLKVIADLTCQVHGSIDCTIRETDNRFPVYTYDPQTRETQLGVCGKGVVMMTNHSLAAILPNESSEHFSRSLYGFIPALAQCDYSLDFDDPKLVLPDPIRRAVVSWHGKKVGDMSYFRFSD